MPLFSEHIANMYYGSSSPYSGSHYSYSSSVSPIGSYSASYLNPGGIYSNHSSIGGYSRAPSTSRWITSSGRNYAPMLSTISERGSGSPIRINSPRRIPLSSRTYGTSNYTPRPVNINTADIDVSKDKYRHKVESYTPPVPNPPPPTSPPENSNDENAHGPFMPRVDGKTETTIDSPAKVERSTIKRGRTVVRLYTIKRKERDSPRKPTEEQKSLDSTNNQEAAQTVDEDNKTDEKEFMKWREKLSDDLAYKDKREKKTLGAKLVEKFIVKDNNEKRSETPNEGQNTAIENSETLPTTSAHVTNLPSSKCLDRRCSLELMAEQANLLDSLIRSENLSTATLDLSKVGTVENKTNLQAFESIKRRKPDNLTNPIKTTKSDHSLHESFKNHQDPKNFRKRRSIKRSSSGSSIHRLDSITELPKEISNPSLPAIEESIPYIQKEVTKPKTKTKLKTKITSSVEVSPPMSPLKFIVEKVTVEEKPRNQKKEITYSSEVEEVPVTSAETLKQDKEQNTIKKIVTNNLDNEKELPSPEPENGNFWDKIGKRETVYLMKRKQNLNEVKEKYKRAFFWFPEDGEEGTSEQSSSNNTQKSDNSIKAKEDKNDNISTNKSTVYGVNEADNIIHKDIYDEVVLDAEIVKQKISAKDTVTDITRKEDRPAESITITGNKSTITPVLDAIKGSISDDLTLEILSKINDNTLQPTTIDVCQEKTNIGKSASLETLNDEKTKVPSQKKTKSEKTKKILKTGINIKEKPIQPIDLQLINKTKVLDNSKYPQTQNNEDKDIALENAVRTSDKQEMANNIITDSDKQKISCPIHPKGLQKVQELNAESEKTKIQYPVNSLGIQKLKATYDSATDNNEVSKKDLPESKLASVTQVTMCASTGDHKENNINTSLINSESINNDVVSKINVIKEIVTKTSDKNNTVECNDSKSNDNMNDLSKNNKTEQGILNASNRTAECKEISPAKVNDDNSSNKGDVKLVNSELHATADNLKVPFKILNKVKTKDNITVNKSSKCDENNKDDESKLALNDSISYSEVPSTSSAKTTTVLMLQKTADSENNSMNSSSQTTIDVPDKQVVVKSQDIPNADFEVTTEARVQSNEKTREENKADNITQKDEVTPEKEIVSPPEVKTPKRPVKEEKAVRPLIATPRPLQKKPPQVIHSSDSSDTSSEEESSEEDNDSDSSESSGEFYECENNPDGRTSTGSNDSGFDSSAPASPATFSQIKKGGDSSATASSSAPAQANNTDILEQELEQSTAYDIFRKTGRFTPPARSIPRFRKYTVEDFQFIKVLGKGSFGKVLLAELRDTEYYYAVKCLKKDVVLEDDDVECTLIERKVLALGTNHPYLCHLFATFQTDSHLFFVMEYLNGGDLMFHIQQSGRFPEARGRFYAAEIVSGLKFLHKRGIVYRDLKLDNILLDYEGHVRIADFGMCKLQIYLEKTADTFCGTPDYMAPEIIKGLKYNQTVDWWSFGVLLYEMLIGQSPFSGCDEDELFWSICNEMPSYPRFLSHEALTILTRLLDKDARTRLGGTECMHGDIRDQEFFHAIHWDRLERRELETPFRPRVRHPMDTQYFDRAFTGERPRLTAVEPQVLRSMDQEPFRGFSYTNPNTTDR